MKKVAAIALVLVLAIWLVMRTTQTPSAPPVAEKTTSSPSSTAPTIADTEPKKNQESGPKESDPQDIAVKKRNGAGKDESDAIRIFGKIVYADSGLPVTGARIWFGADLPDHSRFDEYLSSDGDGSFELEVNQPSTYYYQARKGEYGLPMYKRGEEPKSHHGHIHVEEDMVEIGPVRIELEKLSRLDVYVRDIQSGEPIEGARVGIYRMQMPASSTNSDGFTQIQMSPNTWPVKIWADDYATVTKSVDFSKEPLEPLEVALSAGGVIYGTVLDNNDRPVPGASIQMSERIGFQNVQNTTTDGAGNYLFKGAPIHKPIVISANKKGYLTDRANGLELTLDQREKEWNFKLKLKEEEKGDGVYRFKLIDEDGLTLDGARVHAYGRETQIRLEGALIGDGVYQLDGLLENQAFRLQIYLTNFQSIGREIMAQPPGTAPEIITMNRGYSLSGMVVTPDGEPVSNAKVDLELTGLSSLSSGTNTVEDGSFTFSGLENGKARLEASHVEFSKAVLEDAPLGSEDLVLTLRPATRIIGQLVDAEDGSPLTQFEIKLFTDEYGSPPAVKNANTWETFKDENGVFVWEPISADLELKMTARAEGYKTQNFQVQTTSSPETVVINMEPGTSAISGIVRDTDGRPRGGVTVLLGVETQRNHVSMSWIHLTHGGSFGRGENIEQTVTDIDGRFRLPKIGENLILGVRGGGIAMNLWNDLGKSYNLNQDIELIVQKESIVNGRCNLDKWPNARRVKVSSLKRGFNKEGPVSADGVYQVNGLPSGNYDVVWLDDKRIQYEHVQRATKRISIEAESNTRVDLGFEDTFNLVGQVYSGGALAPGALVYLMVKGGTHVTLPYRVLNRQAADRDGMVRFEDLPEDDYLLVMFSKTGDSQAYRAPRHSNKKAVTIAGEDWSGRLDFKRYTHVFGRFMKDATMVGVTGSSLDGEMVAVMAMVNAGRFDLFDVPPGNYSVIATIDSSHRTIGEVTVNPGDEQIDLGELDLTESGTLHITVLDLPSSEQYMIEVISTDEALPLIKSVNDGSTSISMTSVPTGNLSVTARGFGMNHAWESNSIPVNLAPGDEKNIQLNARQITMLILEYTNRSDELETLTMTGPGPPVSLRSQGLTNFDQEMLGKPMILTSYMGWIKDLTPGEWNLKLETKSKTLIERQVTLGLGKPERLRLDE